MNDDEYGALLLWPLAGEPGGPPGIDVARAIREGRRMRRRRWAFGGGFLAAISAALVTGSLLITSAAQHRPVLPPDPPLPTTCTVAALPTGKQTSVEVIGGDSTGRWHFGRSDPPAGAQHLLVWHDGVLVGDAELPGFELDLNSINSSGVIVGNVNDKKTGIRPYVYRDGKFSPLKGGVGEAAEINDDGIVVGRLGDDTHPYPVRWRSPDAVPERLPIPAGSVINPKNLTIAPDGAIAGVVFYPAAWTRAHPSVSPSAPVSGTYLWLPDGTTRRIEAPPAAADPQASVNPLTFRNGWLYAEQLIGDKAVGIGAIAGVQLLRYHAGSGTWQKIGDGKAAHAADLPGAGRSLANAGTPTPSVYVGASVLVLPLTAPLADPDVDYASVQSISDDAHTVTGWLRRGTGGLPAQPDRPIIWHCA